MNDDRVPAKNDELEEVLLDFHESAWDLFFEYALREPGPEQESEQVNGDRLKTQKGERDA